MKKKLLAGLAVGVMIFGVVEMSAAESLILNGDFTGNTTGTATPNDWINGDGGWGESTYLSSYDGRIGVMQFKDNGAGIWQIKNPVVPIVSDLTFSITFKIDNASLEGDGWYGIESPMNIMMNFTKSGYPDSYVLKRYNYTNDSGSANNHNFELVSQSTWITKTYDLSPLDVPVGYDFSSISISSTGWQITTFVDNVSVEANTAPVPEPATMLLMGTGLAGLIGARRKKQ